MGAGVSGHKRTIDRTAGRYHARVMTPARDEILLLPKPRSLRRHNAEVNLPKSWTESHIVFEPLTANTHGPEEYQLRVAPGPEIRVRSATRAGARAALATFKQLRHQFGDQLPEIDIHDWPAFAHRGIMLDVSRDRVPRMDELFSIVTQLAGLKINHLQLYTEHTFAYVGHEEVWRGWSPLTPDEIRRLDAHCKSHGITLAANQNCFGHLASWLRLPKYAPLAEIQGAETPWSFYEFTRQGPFSLCPGDPGSIALIEDLLSQLLPCFSSGLVNINSDETFDVGHGRSRERVAQLGSAAVYFEFLGKVARACRARNFTPMFWADIALNHADAADQIPEGLIALAWGYEPDAKFAEWCQTLRRAGRETWVCPGTSSWRSITGRTTERRGNISAAARDGLTNGAIGMLTCDWGDVGHRQQWPISLHGIAHAADAAWAGDGDSFNLAAESLQVFNDRTLAIGAWLDRLGDADLTLRNVAGRTEQPGVHTVLRNATGLFGLGLLNEPIRGTLSAWNSALQSVRAIAREPRGTLSSQLEEEIKHTLEVAEFAAERGVQRAGGAAMRAAPDRLRNIIHEHRRLWLARSRDGGLDHSCGFYEQLELPSA